MRIFCTPDLITELQQVTDGESLRLFSNGAKYDGLKNSCNDFVILIKFF